MTSISFFYAARSKSNIKAYLWTSLIGLPSCWNHFKMAKSGLIERSADHLRMTFQLQHIDICWPLSELSTVWFEKNGQPPVGCTTPLKNGPKWYKNLVIFGIHFVVRRRESWTPNCKLARGALRVLLLYIYMYMYVCTAWNKSFKKVAEQLETGTLIPDGHTQWQNVKFCQLFRFRSKSSKMF